MTVGGWTPRNPRYTRPAWEEGPTASPEEQTQTLKLMDFLRGEEPETVEVARPPRRRRGVRVPLVARARSLWVTLVEMVQPVPMAPQYVPRHRRA